MATKKEKTVTEKVKKEIGETLEKKLGKEFRLPELSLWQKMALVASVTLAMIQTVKMWQGVFRRLAK